MAKTISLYNVMVVAILIIYATILANVRVVLMMPIGAIVLGG